MRRGPHWFSGSADAIYQNLNLIYDERPDVICVFGADHVYRIDPRQMVRQHLESGAGVTVAGLRVPIEQAREFGVMDVSDDGRSIVAFREKPEHPVGLPDAPDEVMASMGNYVFGAQALIDAVTADSKNDASTHDIGRDIITMMVDAGPGPGLRLREPPRPRRLGARARLLAGHREPRRVLRRSHGPDLARPDLQPLQPQLADPQAARPAPAREVRVRGSRPHRDGGRLDGLRGRDRRPAGIVRRSVLSPEVSVRSGAKVEGSILMDGVDRRRERDRSERDRRQERRDRAGREARRRRRARPAALRRLARRDRRRRQGRACHGVISRSRS